MNLGEITRTLIEFREKRRWERYHTPKNLAISAAVELGELLEEINKKLLDMGVRRIYMVIKTDYRVEGGSIEQKKRSVMEKL